jgi:hypothetical protein
VAWRLQKCRNTSHGGGDSKALSDMEMASCRCTLGNNLLSDMEELHALRADALPLLKILSLENNAIGALPHYRMRAVDASPASPCSTTSRYTRTRGSTRRW